MQPYSQERYRAYSRIQSHAWLTFLGSAPESHVQNAGRSLCQLYADVPSSRSRYGFDQYFSERFQFVIGKSSRITVFLSLVASLVGAQAPANTPVDKTAQAALENTGWALKVAKNLRITKPVTEKELVILREELDPTGIYTKSS